LKLENVQIKKAAPKAAFSLFSWFGTCLDISC